MAINEASLIKVKANQLLDATTVASLAILLSSGGVTQMHKMVGLEVSIVATKAMAIRAMVVVMVMVMVMVVLMGRLVVGPMP